MLLSGSACLFSVFHTSRMRHFKCLKTESTIVVDIWDIISPCLMNPQISTTYDLGFNNDKSSQWRSLIYSKWRAVTKLTPLCQNVLIPSCQNVDDDCRLVFVFNESETFHKTKFHQNKSFYHREFLKYETFQFRFHFYGECSSMATSKWVVISYHEAKINIGTTWKMADVVL